MFDLSSNALTGALPSWLGIEARGKAPAPVDLLLFGNAFTNGCYPDFGNIQGVCTANGTGRRGRSAAWRVVMWRGRAWGGGGGLWPGWPRVRAVLVGGPAGT